MPIKKSLRIILVLFSIIPAVVVGLITYSYVENTLISSRRNTLDYLAASSSNQISSILETQITELKLQCSKEFFKSSLSNLNIPSNAKRRHTVKNPRTLQSTLTVTASHYPFCTSYAVYDTDFCCVSTSNSDFFNNTSAEYNSLISGLENTAADEVSLTTFKQGSNYLIDITKSILNDHNEIIGYMTSTVKTNYFNYIFEVSSFGSSGQALFVDQNGMILFGKESSMIGTTLSSTFLKQMLGKENGSKANNLIHRYDGIERLFSIAPIAYSDWYIITYQDMSEIIKPANMILVSLLVCCTLVIIIACFASFRFSLYYTKPIYILRDTMKQVSNGDFTIRCHIDLKNEIGELARSFNKMIQIIQTSYNDLSSMHEKLLDNEEEIRSNYDHIEYLAYHDLLTNLPNKLSFLENVNPYFTGKNESLLMHAIYFIDLDNFKTINDTLGHDFGDEILSSTGKRLSSLIGSQDVVARVGGDEFLVFKYNITSEEDALQFSQQMITCFAKPFNIHNETLYLSLSIGIAIYPLHGTTHKILVKNADIAMYKSKERGKNRASVFNQSMSEELNRSSEILEILRFAIANKEVYLMYQPQVDIRTHTIIGYEALMRINSKKLGFLSPQDFIPIAEESGLIVDLGFWALEEACRFNKSLLDNGTSPCAVSVNISSIQLNKPGFVRNVQKILEKTGLPPNYLELEITESTLISSLVDTVAILNSFKAMGVRISLDDFGTGYSSLKYLTSLPITTLKIDKSFIDNICFNAKDSYIAKSIIMLAHQINVTVIAEGVEDKRQFALLKDEDCDTIQGFLFSQPLLPDELIRLLKNGLPQE